MFNHILKLCTKIEKKEKKKCKQKDKNFLGAYGVSANRPLISAHKTIISYQLSFNNHKYNIVHYPLIT